MGFYFFNLFLSYFILKREKGKLFLYKNPDQEISSNSTKIFVWNDLEFILFEFEN